MPTTYNVSTQEQAPWSGQQPYLDYLFNQARSVYEGGGPQYYPGTTVAPFSDPQERAMSAIESRAAAGSPVTRANTSLAANVLEGNYLNANPYLDQTFDIAAAKAKAPIESMFSRSGRYGSQINPQLVGRQMNELASNIYGGNYAQERANQMAMAQLAPTIANQEYYDARQMMDVGNIVQKQAQDVIGSNVDRYAYNQNLPVQNLATYQSMVGSPAGATTTTTQPAYSDPYQSLLGSALAAGSLFGSEGFGGEGSKKIDPYAALAGGLLDLFI